MKKLFIFIFLGIVIAYIAGWFYATNLIKTKLESYISENHINLTYKNIEISGFPFNFLIKIQDPVYKYKDQENNISAKLKGDLLFETGLFATGFHLTTNAPWEIQGNVKDYYFNILVKAQKNTEYAIKFRETLLSKKFIVSILRVKNDPYVLFEIIDYIRIHGAGLKVDNLLTNAQLIDIKKYNFKLGLSEKHTKDYKIIVEDKLEEANFGKEFTVLWNNLNDAIPFIQKISAKVSLDLLDYFRVLNLPQRGKINHDILLSYSGNLDPLKPNFKVEISKLYIKDLLTYISLKGKIKYNYKAVDLSDLHIKIQGISSFSKKWVTLFQKYVSDYNPHFFNFLKVTNPSSSLLKLINTISDFLMLKKTNKEIYIPRINELGEIKFNTDLKVNLLSKDYFQVKAEPISLHTSQNDIKLEGQYIEKLKQEKYKFELNISNYLSLVDGVLNYINKVGSRQNILLLINGGKFEISPKVNKEIKNFIRKVSNNPSSTSPDITLFVQKGFDQKYPSVGRYDSTQFDSELNKLKTKLVVGEVSRNLQKFLPKDKNKKLNNILKGLDQFGGFLQFSN